MEKSNGEKGIHRKPDIGQLKRAFGHGFIVKQEKEGTKQQIKKDYQQHKSIGPFYTDLLASTALLLKSVPHCFGQHP
jgi:hypothetical protein